MALTCRPSPIVLGLHRPVRHRRQRDHHGQPAARGVLGLERAAHPLDEALRQREAEPEAGAVVGVAEPLERRRRSRPAVRPGRPGRGRRPAARRRRRRRSPTMRTLASAGEWRRALSSRLTRTRCSSTASAEHGRQRRPQRRARRRPGPRPSSSRAPSTTSSTSTRRASTASTPAWTRLTSSRSVTRVASASRLSWAVASSSSRSASLQATSVCRSPLTAAVAAASGRRRSWPTAASSALRIRSASASGATSRAVAAQLGVLERPPRPAPRSTPSSRRSAAARRAAVQFERRVGRRRRSTWCVAARRPGCGTPSSASRASPSDPARTTRTRVKPEGLAGPADERLQGVLAAQHAARDRGEQLGLGAPASAGASPPGRLVDHVADDARRSRRTARAPPGAAARRWSLCRAARRRRSRA